VQFSEAHMAAWRACMNTRASAVRSSGGARSAAAQRSMASPAQRRSASPRAPSSAALRTRSAHAPATPAAAALTSPCRAAPQLGSQIRRTVLETKSGARVCERLTRSNARI